MDTVALGDLPQRYTAFNFLFPVEKKPQFGNNRVDVTRAAADKVAGVFNSLVARGETRERAQRFVLQCVVAMFSEDAELLPRGLFSELLDDCRGGESSYDLIGGLFRQMNSPDRARGGRYKNVRYFNGGVFQTIEPVELTRRGNRPAALRLGRKLEQGAAADLRHAVPKQHGQGGTPCLRCPFHQRGRHSESRPADYRAALAGADRSGQDAAETCTALRDELLAFRVLDPACGSGNFLYVAYRELKHLEFDLMAKIHANFGAKRPRGGGTQSQVSARSNSLASTRVPFAVELAKVTLMLAKELAIDESRHWLDAANSSTYR